LLTPVSTRIFARCAHRTARNLVINSFQVGCVREREDLGS